MFLAALAPQPATAEIRVHRNLTVAAGLAQSQVLSLAEDREGALWIGTNDGASRWDGAGFTTLQSRDGMPAGPVYSIVPRPDGTVWFVTANGAAWYRNGRIERAPAERGPAPSPALREPAPGLETSRISQTAEAPDGATLFATDRGLARWIGGKLSWLTSEATTSVAVAPDGAIFAGTPSSGALVWTSPGAVPERIGVEHGLASNQISAVLASSSGAVVFGTDDGASLWDRGRVATWTATDGLPERSIWAFADDDRGGLWIGGDGGLVRRDGARFRLVSGLPRAPVRSLASGPPGRLFAGTQGGGLWEIEVGAGRERLARVWTQDDGLPDPFVRALARDNDGALWIGTPRGLAVLRDGRITPGPVPLDRADVYAITVDAAGGILVAAADGVFGLDGLDGLRVRSFGGMPARPGLAFLSSPLSIGRRTWIGTSGGLGLLRGDRIERVAVAGGLGNETINCLAADGVGRLFASTNRGVEVLRLAGNGLAAADRLAPADGLASAEGNLGACFRDTRGRLWFGSIGGAAEVDPARIAPRPPPRVAWTGASLGGLPVVLPSPGVSLHLPPGAGSLALSWIGVDIATPEAVIYQTRFAGLDSAWTPTDRRTVQLASPAPGSYRFEVRAARRGGEWSPILALDFVAEAPLWRRGWFRLIVALALLGLVGTLAAWRVRQLLAIERLRTEIAADLHDHVGAGLTEIAILAEIAGRRAAGPEGTDAAPEIARAAETARGLIDRMDDIVWLVNPRRDSLHELFVRLKDSYAELFSAQGVLFRATNLRLFEGVRLPMAQRENLLAIFREALANALWHSGCREIALDVELRRRTLEVTLRDDGTGFDPGHVK
ncbi:MAG TPA: two-component regulator propeller domain-containing protein, partial [Thermoanaerobaculia bacterium]|nr:two-component regulator propeller domain-containing protein [Thermoanaerobaculia bacterium]